MWVSKGCIEATHPPPFLHVPPSLRTPLFLLGWVWPSHGQQGKLPESPHLDEHLGPLGPASIRHAVPKGLY
jgi:hypothetical protein